MIQTLGSESGLGIVRTPAFRLWKGSPPDPAEDLQSLGMVNSKHPSWVLSYWPRFGRTVERGHLNFGKLQLGGRVLAWTRGPSFVSFPAVKPEAERGREKAGRTWGWFFHLNQRTRFLGTCGH